MERLASHASSSSCYRCGAGRFPVRAATPTCRLGRARAHGKTIVCRARGKKKEEEARNGGGLSPNLEMAVPSEQRPVNELSAKLKIAC